MTLAISVTALIVSALALWNAALAREELRDYDRTLARSFRRLGGSFRAGSERTRERTRKRSE